MKDKRKGRRKARREAAGKRRDRRRRVLIGAAVCLTLGACLVLFWPRPVWYVEGEFFGRWARVLREGNPPFKRLEALPAGGVIPPGRYGYIISRNPPALEGSGTDLPVRVYRDLVMSRELEGAQALALNPWMMFRKHQDPEPVRERIDALGGGEGMLALPGADRGAVWAWVSQLVQERPGVFPHDAETWERASEGLFQGRRFQPGASTYNWVDLWPALNRPGTVWLYAPLNRVRELPVYRMGMLDATRFPEREGWNVYGIQADILWAAPFGTERQVRGLGKVRDWLRSAAVQTLIANTIDWIPAHPQGTPYNTVSWQAQTAWIGSSFVWQEPGGNLGGMGSGE